jgi:large subunit ribosomal protein L31e
MEGYNMSEEEDDEEIEEVAENEAEEKKEKVESIIEEEIKEEISTELQDEISEEVEQKLIELEEEEYKPRIVKEEFEEEYILERTYIVPFRRVLNTVRKKRAKKAVNILRDFIWKHMKPVDVIIHPEVNEKIWERGIEKPPSKIRVRASKDREGLVYVYLA